MGDVNYGAVSTSEQQAGGQGRSAPRNTAGGVFATFPPLDQTRAEITAIRDSFEQRFGNSSVRMLRKDGATEAAFRKAAPRHRWLQLATHGFFAPPELKSALSANSRKLQASNLLDRDGIEGFDPGLLSGIALSGANEAPQLGEDDGILTALEVSALDLGGVELAVLSACETGLGKTAGGEGLLGLQRAFQIAGARAVMASLWKVPDLATSHLMQRFYENLWDKKLPKGEALRQAQLWLMKEGRTRGLDVDEKQAPATKSNRLPPKYWAGFVLSGDWR